LEQPFFVAQIARLGQKHSGNGRSEKRDWTAGERPSPFLEEKIAHWVTRGASFRSSATAAKKRAHAKREPACSKVND
jgi:hypothetical protein